MKLSPCTFPLPLEQVEALCEPVQDPFVAGSEVHLEDRDGPNEVVTVHFDDVVTLDCGDHATLSRLGIINALLDQAIPGLRLVAHVPHPTEDSSPDNVYGLSLQVLP